MYALEILGCLFTYLGRKRTKSKPDAESEGDAQD